MIRRTFDEGNARGLLLLGERIFDAEKIKASEVAVVCVEGLESVQAVYEELFGWKVKG